MSYESKSANGRLFLIPCPIAENATATLSEEIPQIVLGLQHFLVENVRSARRFISSLKLGIDISELQFYILDKKTEEAQVAEYFKAIGAGSDIGVISEAGCPGVADPGAVAVALAHRQGREVVPLVGPSSILLALMGSGFSGQQFTFHGYLPIQTADLGQRLRQLEDKAYRERSTEIFMETPFRNDKLLQALLSHFKKDTKLCIACDLTSATGSIKTKTIGQWAKQVPDLHKRPTVFLISS